MRKVSQTRRFLALVLAIAMAFTLSATDTAPVYAASAKAVKSVTLKIGSKNVTKKTSTMKVGQTAAIKTTVKPSSAKKSVAYKSNKTSVATVSKSGKVTAKKAGTAKITVVVTGKNKKKKTSYVTIKVQNVNVTKVRLNKSSLALTAGGSGALKASVSPSNATNRKITWSSNNNSVASVNAAGKVTAKKAGTAMVTAKAHNGKSASCRVTVKAPTVAVTGVRISQTSCQLETGSSVVLTAEVTPSNATNKTIAWNSSNTRVATVSNGTVRAVSAGTAVITASSGGKTASCRITVSEPIPVASVDATIEKSIITVGKVTSIRAVVLPEDASERSLTYTSSDERVAVVNQAGLVTAIGVGTADIRISSSNGKFKIVTVTVEEKPKEGITLEVLKPYTGKDGTVYSNTVLVGTPMTVRARVIQNGEPLANTSVTLDLRAEYGGVLGNAAINPANFFEIRSDDVLTTDQDGYAEFVIGLTQAQSATTATDGVFQSYTVTAKTAATAGDLTESISVKFASVVAAYGVDVDNNYFANIPDIDPSENASPWDTGVARTVSTNGWTTEEYVTSQKVTMEDGTDDNKVYFDAAPRIVIPATQDNVETGTWKISRADGTLVGGVSGSYSVYNDETNTTTTTTVYDVPAGLQHITLKFDKIKLSQYTYMSVDLYGKETGALLDSKQQTASAVGSNASVQVGRQLEEDAYVVVSIQSQGIVDTSNEGYDLYEISGPWALNGANNGRLEELPGTVTWTDVSDEVTYETADMSFAEATPYFETGCTHLNTNYQYTCSVPVFPYTGNAVIRVYNAEKTEILAYYLYPTVRQAGDNVNILAPAPGDPNDDTMNGLYAVYASQQEAETLKKGMSTLQQNGNEAVVDSFKTGMTELRADISVEGLTRMELNDNNGGKLYTSVLWSPNPRAEETEPVPDYFAVEGQSVVVTAQLYDFNNNPVSDSGKNVSFTYGDLGTRIIGQGQNIGGDGADARTQATVASFSSTTDMNGQIQIRLSGTATEQNNLMRTSYVENLTAAAAGYKVALSFDQNTAPSLNVTKGNIYWVDLGTSLVDDAVNPALTFNFVDTIFADDEERNTTVDKSWYVGYKVVARSEKFAYTRLETRGFNEFVSITGVPIVYDKNGKGNVTHENSIATISSDETGIMNLTGRIDSKNLKDVVFTYYDEFGDTKVCPNVGVGESATLSNTGIQLKIKWNPYGMKLNLVTPDGTSLYKDTASAVYVKVTDQKDNVIDDQVIRYTIAGTNATAGTMNAVRVAAGIYRIALPAPGVAGTSFINVRAGDDETLQEQIQITYTDSNVEDFGVRPDQGTEYSVEVVADDQLKVYFNNAVKSDTLMKEMFKFVQDGAGDNVVTYEVKEVSLSTDNNAILLTLDKKIANTDLGHTLTYNAYTNVDGDNIEHSFMDMYGQKLAEGTEVKFVPSARRITK